MVPIPFRMRWLRAAVIVMAAVASACASSNGAVPRPFPVPGERAASRPAPLPERPPAVGVLDGTPSWVLRCRCEARPIATAAAIRTASIAADLRSTSSRSLASHFRVKSGSSIARANRSIQPTSRQATWCSSQQLTRACRTWQSWWAAINSSTLPARAASSEWSVSARPTGRRAMSARDESAKQRGKPLFE